MMSPNIRCRASIVALLAALSPAGARADVVEASSSTILSARMEYRDGQAVRVVPLYEMLSVSARDIHTSFADFQVVLSTWGELDFGPNLTWGPIADRQSRLTGDVDVLYLQADFAKRAVAVRLGRFVVPDGTSRMTQLDGGEARLQLPFGLGVSGYAGSPVSARFMARGGAETWNPVAGDFTAGGRVFYVLPRWGELGASIAYASDHGDPSREDVGVDLRLTPLRSLTLLGSAFYGLYDSRLGEGNAQLLWQWLPKLQLGAEYRYVEPGLLLPRNSILSVFTEDTRNEVGLSVHAGPFSRVSVDLEVFDVMESDRPDGTRVRARGTWRPRASTALGLEVAWLYDPISGYVYGRAFASQDVGPFFLSADLQDAHYTKPVNGFDNSFLGTANVGYRIGGGFSALLSGTAGTTPFLSSRFDFLAKLAYNATYAMREVR